MASLGAEPVQREMGVMSRRGDGVAEYSAIDFVPCQVELI